MKKVVICLFLFLFVSYQSKVNAQAAWSLEKCINYAVENNLNIKQSQLAFQQAQLTEQLNRNARLPSLNGSSNVVAQFGRTIDPVTNEFSINAFSSQTLGLNANAILYNGGRINNQIEQSKLNAMAAREDLLQNQNDIALTVATSYINTLFAKERTSNAKQQLALTNIQIENTNKLIRAGALPENDILDLESQAALNQQEIIIQENAANNALLNLKLILQLPADEEFDIVNPNIKSDLKDDLDTQTLDGIYQEAVQNQHFIKAGKYRMESASLNEKIAKANKLPSLSIFGGINSRFSDQAPLFGDPTTTLIESPVQIAGSEVLIGQNVTIPNVIGTVPYFDQLSDNLGQNIGLSLNVPIYNNGQANIAQEQAKLNLLNTEYANEQLNQNLRSDIQQALTDAKAAKLQLAAAEKAVTATQTAFENSEKNFNLGGINSLELSIARNRLDATKIDLIVAKYQYLFNLKVIDFYRGESISF
jgi:outer membrane protein